MHPLQETTMTGLFPGTADHYRRFRLPYPQETFDWIVARHGLDGTGQLLEPDGRYWRESERQWDVLHCITARPALEQP